MRSPTFVDIRFSVTHTLCVCYCAVFFYRICKKKFSDYAVHVFQIRKNRLLYAVVLKSVFVRKNAERITVRAKAVSVCSKIGVVVLDVLNGNLLKMSIRRSTGSSEVC